MRHYRLSPDVYLERFDEDAILFVADRARMVTVNRAAAELYEAACTALSDRPFTPAEGAELLLRSYDLAAEDALRQVQAMLAFGLRQRIVERAA